MVILGIDLGRARTGLAICDKSEMLSTPLAVLSEKKTEVLADRVCAIIQEKGVELVVLGLPKNMDGTEGDSAIRSRQFGEILKEKTGLPVEFMDERGTTITAHGYLNDTNTRGKKRKATVDAVAATIILQNFLDYRKNNKI